MPETIIIPLKIIGIGLLGIIFLKILITYILGLRVIKSNEIGIVEKWWSTKGSLKNSIIALNKEAGYQPDVLRAGIHFRSAIMYKVKKAPLITIPQGQIGYVFARDGQALEPTQSLGKVIKESNNFQDVRAFIQNGGQKGPQRDILREGTYAFNLAQFVVITENKTYCIDNGNATEMQAIESMAQKIRENNGFKPMIIKGDSDFTGIVTIHDGPSLPNGEIIAPIVGENPKEGETYHNNFQNPEAFLRAGGFRGRQYQVITDGTYYLNGLFATVELVKKVVIPVGYVGVVVSYTGRKGKDESGEGYKHGELVENGCKGVWKEPLNPGKYAFNTYAGSISLVPTTNIILKWIQGETDKTHKYDENLKEVDIITQDAFQPTLPLSVVINIDYRKAPLVIQRFGDIKMLVEQTLDPMVSSYFKNIGQKRTLIELIQDRTEIQDEAAEKMKEKFNHYSLELEEVLIGTPSAENDKKIETILQQLRDRQVAKEQIETYQHQTKAAEKEKILKEYEAKAKQQSALTESEINIDIESNKGAAEYRKALQEAEQIKALAEARAAEIKIIASAEAEKEEKVGIAKAVAINKQVEAYGGPQYQVAQIIGEKFAEAIKIAKVPIVPKNMVTLGGNGEHSNASILDTVLALTMNKQLGIDLSIDSEEDNEIIEKEIDNTTIANEPKVNDEGNNAELNR